MIFREKCALRITLRKGKNLKTNIFNAAKCLKQTSPQKMEAEVNGWLGSDELGRQLLTPLGGSLKKTQYGCENKNQL